MSAAQIKVKHKCFKDGRESVESDSHSGRPATGRTPENAEHVQDAINKDQWLTVWELEAGLGIPKTTVSKRYNTTKTATAMGKWWLAASSRQCTPSCITSHAEFFGKTSNQPPYSQDLAFSKIRITFEREQISGPWWESGKYHGAANGIPTKDFAVFWTVEEML